jgi:Rieske Fe-S protein
MSTPDGRMTRTAVRRRGLLAASAVGCLSTAAGCASDDPDDRTPDATSSSDALSSGPAAAQPLAAEADVQDVPLEIARLSSGDPGYLVRDHGQIVLLSAVCSHAGCIVRWRAGEDAFVCPCHRGTYDIAGDVVSGPPPAPLDRLPCEVRNGQIFETAP